MTSTFEMVWKFSIVINVLYCFCVWNICYGQQTNIHLEQGVLMGLKVFPDSSRTAVYAFLGIPYAQAPVGQERFKHAKPHLGWNGTLQATNMKPICNQLANTIYDETEGSLAPPARMDEDCLYLNIWVPEAGNNNLPVIVIITGEEMSYDWPRHRATGLDFAAEGVVVVNIQYRSNIFGWISTSSKELERNYGLGDQQLALQWIQKNIKFFGGNPTQVTLLGHGTSGAPCALIHALTWRENDALFSKLILMSPGDIDYYLDAKSLIEEASRVLIKKLGCHFEEFGNQASCLRTKSVSDLLKAYESIYNHGNGTLVLGPLLEGNWRHILKNKVRTGNFPPVIVGITSNEGAFLQDYWLDLARNGYDSLREYINYTVLPKIVGNIMQGSNSKQVLNTLNWRYFTGESAHSVPYLLKSLQKLLSEWFFERPYYNILQLLLTDKKIKTTAKEPPVVYAYVSEVPTSMDMRGRINLFGGTSHTSDLPFIFGPSLFQQISRRRFSAEEDKVCRKMRTTFVNFLKNGNPTPGRLYDAWLPFKNSDSFIYKLGVATGKSDKLSIATGFQDNLKQIEKLVKPERSSIPPHSRSNRHEYNNPYQLGQPVLPSSSESDGRRVKVGVYGTTDTYYSNQQDSGYGQHLQRLHDFWLLVLPNVRNTDGSFLDAFGEHMRLMEVTADAARYRQGFYAMLGLVCALLAILCLCVYLLRRDPFATTTRRKHYSL